MNSIDVLILIALCAGTVIGFLHGLLRTVLHIVALYGVTVVAAFAYPVLGDWLRYIVPGTSRQLRNADAFLLLVLALFNLFALYFRHLLKDKETPLPGVVDRLGGLVLGFFFTAVWIGLGVLLGRFLLSVSWLEADQIRFGLLGQLRHSALAALFQQLLPYAVATLKPWFAPFGGLPELFILN